MMQKGTTFSDSIAHSSFFFFVLLAHDTLSSQLPLLGPLSRVPLVGGRSMLVSAPESVAIIAGMLASIEAPAPSTWEATAPAVWANQHTGSGNIVWCSPVWYLPMSRDCRIPSMARGGRSTSAGVDWLALCSLGTSGRSWRGRLQEVPPRGVSRWEGGGVSLLKRWPRYARHLMNDPPSHSLMPCTFSLNALHPHLPPQSTSASSLSCCLSRASTSFFCSDAEPLRPAYCSQAASHLPPSHPPIPPP